VKLPNINCLFFSVEKNIKLVTFVFRVVFQGYKMYATLTVQENKKLQYTRVVKILGSFCPFTNILVFSRVLQFR